MIIDVHTHIFPREFIEKRSEYASLDATFAELYRNEKAQMITAEQLIEYMDKVGIEQAVAQAIGWGTNRLCHIHNEYMAEVQAKYGHRLLTLGIFNPVDQSGAQEELEFCYDAGLSGIGELRPDKQGFNIKDKTLLYPFIRFMWKNNMFLSLHCSEPVGHVYDGKSNILPQDIYTFLLNFPDLKVLLAHFGGGLPFYALMPEVKEIFKNAVVDCAAQPYLYSNDVYEICARILGQDKIMFGSDYPLLKLERYKKETEYLSKNFQEKLFFSNAQKFINKNLDYIQQKFI